VKNKEFYFYTVLTIVTATATATTFNTVENYQGVISGLLALITLLTSKKTLENTKIKIRSPESKITTAFLPLTYELIIITGINLSKVIPRYLVIASTASIIIYNFTEKTISKELRKTVKPAIGEKTRIIVLSIGLILTTINITYITYAMALITVLSIYDTLEMIYRQIV